MSKVVVYSTGLVHCSACALDEMAGPDVAAEVERTHPAGTEAGWQISSDPTFRSGEPNPCPCNIGATPARRHWLLDC